MRDAMLMAGMLILLPLALTSSFRAYLIWCWTGLVGINFYVYGFMKGMPFNQIFALLTFAVLFLRKDPERGRITSSATLLFFALFALHCTLSAVSAYPGVVRNAELYTQVLKVMLFCLLMPIILTHRYRIHLFVVAVFVSLAVHGLLDGLKTIASGGGHRVVGIAKFGDNNHTAVLLVMQVPIALYLYQYSASRLVRFVLLITLALLIAAIIGTHSRGGLVSLVAACAWLILLGRRKLIGLVALVLGLSVILTLAPSDWEKRMDTITSAEEDESFMGRVKAWKISSAIALENPITGGGFHALENPNIWTRFREAPSIMDFVATGPADIHPHAAHSNYFEVMGDLGFVGLALYLAILLNSFFMKAAISREAKHCGPKHRWAGDLANALGASLFAYAIGGAAVSMAYYEIFYILVMLMAVVRQYAFAAALPTNARAPA